MKSEEKIRALLGDFNPATPPPRIDPVPEGVHRPRWSVMIPTFNCAHYLRQTLESVLAQAPGPEQMQIEVIDDCSTKDDPEAVVHEVGKGRVTFHRKEKNEGAIRNFNTCIGRSRGNIVHILHGDDYVDPQFYRAMERLHEEFPNVGIAASRTLFVDEKNVPIGMSPRMASHKQPSNDALPFFYDVPLQFAGVTVKRSAYEKEAGFDESLVHCADNDMWARLVERTGGVVSSRCLAYYRIFELNDSGRLQRTGENMRDYERFGRTVLRRTRGFDMRRYHSCMWDWWQPQIRKFREVGDEDAIAANIVAMREVMPHGEFMRRSLATRLESMAQRVIRRTLGV